MRRPRHYFLAALFIFVNGLSMARAGDERASGDAVEVVVQGRQYPSMRAYKREQIKAALQRVFSSQDLGAFSEDELCEIIKDVRQQQTAGGSSKEPSGTAARSPDETPQGQEAAEGSGRGLSDSQMREMLKDYLREHTDAGTLLIDPGKVKDMIIGPAGQPEDIPQE